MLNENICWWKNFSIEEQQVILNVYFPSTPLDDVSFEQVLYIKKRMENETFKPIKFYNFYKITNVVDALEYAISTHNIATVYKKSNATKIKVIDDIDYIHYNTVNQIICAQFSIVNKEKSYNIISNDIITVINNNNIKDIISINKVLTNISVI